uniref:Uncharacterized protein n=1 Tax=Aegilops tauschii subsp. strangulata TaxID=200361 RepID=A0A453B0P3_AEGTS
SPRTPHRDGTTSPHAPTPPPRAFPSITPPPPPSSSTRTPPTTGANTFNGPVGRSSTRSSGHLGRPGPQPMLPFLPAFNDTNTATAFSNSLRSPHPVKVPGPVTHRGVRPLQLLPRPLLPGPQQHPVRRQHEQRLVPAPQHRLPAPGLPARTNRSVGGSLKSAVRQLSGSKPKSDPDSAPQLD